MRHRGLNIVSLFAGAGGLEIAACSTGCVRCIVSTDSNAVFLSTTERNMATHFPKVKHQCVVADARGLEGRGLAELADGPIDVVMGGPPCDDFTATGLRRGMRGNKGHLINEFARLVRTLKPTVFLFENVPNLVQQFRRAFDDYLDRWRKEGWCCEWRLLNAYDYGAPTLRKRVFMIGLRDVTMLKGFEFPAPTHGPKDAELSLFGQELRPFVTVGDVLSDLPDVRTPEADAMSLNNHEGRNHKQSTIRHMSQVRPGVRTRQSYRYRAPADALCWSLTAGLDDSTKAYIHPVFHREMSVREYARIHCFPDSWFFCGTLNNGIKQVANSVPIPLGMAMWRRVHELLGTVAAQTNAARST